MVNLSNVFKVRISLNEEREDVLEKINQFLKQELNSLEIDLKVMGKNINDYGLVKNPFDFIKKENSLNYKDMTFFVDGVFEEFPFRLLMDLSSYLNVDLLVDLSGKNPNTSRKLIATKDCIISNEEELDNDMWKKKLHIAVWEDLDISLVDEEDLKYYEYI